MRYLLTILLLMPGLPACAQYGGQQGFLGYLMYPLLFAAGSSPVESITQVPSTVITGSPAIVTIPAVDMSRSFVICNQTANSSDPNNIVTCQLSAADQVTIQTDDPNNQNVALSVVQFTSGAVVQRGGTTLAAGDSVVNVPIGAVNQARTFVLATSRMNSTDRAVDQQRLVAAYLPDASTLRLSRGETGTAVDVEWQVVELAAASVQSGVESMGNGTASATVPVLAYDSARSFLILNASAASNVLGIENSYYVRGSVAGGTSFSLSRAQATGDLSVAWFLVSMTDLSGVQHGTASFDATYTNTPPLSVGISAVDTGRSILVSNPDILNTGNLTANDDQDSGRVRAAFSSSSTLEFERGSNESPRIATINWSVVQFLN